MSHFNSLDIPLRLVDFLLFIGKMRPVIKDDALTYAPRIMDVVGSSAMNHLTNQTDVYLSTFAELRKGELEKTAKELFGDEFDDLKKEKEELEKDMLKESDEAMEARRVELITKLKEMSDAVEVEVAKGTVVKEAYNKPVKITLSNNAWTWFAEVVHSFQISSESNAYGMFSELGEVMELATKFND